MFRRSVGGLLRGDGAAIGQLQGSTARLRGSGALERVHEAVGTHVLIDALRADARSLVLE